MWSWIKSLFHKHKYIEQDHYHEERMMVGNRYLRASILREECSCGDVKVKSVRCHGSWDF